VNFYRYLRLRLSEAGLLPASKVALITWYLLALDLLLFVLQKMFGLLQLSYGDSFAGWVNFLSFAVIVLFLILAFRWIKTKALWRLRNRLIVTYVFIGVIPVVLLVALAMGSFYLFAGQFATFIVTTGLNSELTSLETSNSTIARQLAGQEKIETAKGSVALASLVQADKERADRRVWVWLDGKPILNSSPAGASSTAPVIRPYLKGTFRGVVRDHDKLCLRALETMPIRAGSLTVLSSEPLDQSQLQKLAANLGEITLFEGLSLRKLPAGSDRDARITSGDTTKSSITFAKPDGTVLLDTTQATPTAIAGAIPPPAGKLDMGVVFPTSISVVDWENGSTANPSGLRVNTRVSKLYERLFAAQGDFAPAVEIFLLVAVLIFALIEVVAIFIGTRLTRTVTRAVAQLYDATKRINRGDFSQRIPVKSSDQVAALANSFNSMTASLEQLIEEQKEKQKLENELVIAQEVQAQLFPRQITQLASLEVHGFCRPARTVSGDYYDFLRLDSERLLLAVGDISGKGISAALLMATIHSAVRAYSVDNMRLRELVAAGYGPDPHPLTNSHAIEPEVAPGVLLALLNHQLFESTPSEKYATLFLGIYDGARRKLTYSNGGHLPPIIMSEDGSVRRLECGGTVVGLFDQRHYDEDTVALRPGEIFLAYSDGITEPENEFGEFGDQRLIDLLRANRQLLLPRISELVTAAVDDWIGQNEQPDDITLVLARAR